MYNLNRVSLIGAGAMGQGLAVQCAVTNHDVTLIDHRQKNIDDAQNHIRDIIQFLNENDLSKQDPISIMDKITFSTDSEKGVETADVVLESITEDVVAKQRLFKKITEAAPIDAVFASNTSSIQISEIAEGVPEYSDRIGGCHWWYPPYLLEPVEVIRGQRTSDETFERLCSFVESTERDPILVERDVPGFVWNRIQFAVVRECLHIVEEGIATPQEVNRAIRDGYAIRTAAIGPFETMDIAGLDLFSAIAEDLYPELASDEKPQEQLRKYADRGQTGIETRSGFFEYENTPEDIISRRDERIAAIRRALNRSSPD
ncbi:3-hydroxyacyl-CoA dehydrogenase family protein [Natrialbaceae archaeon A-CW1-1]